MQTSDILKVVDNFTLIKRRFVGVFPLDEIPEKMLPKTCAIFNRDCSDGTGSHWISLVHSKENNYEIFDSLGTRFSEIRPYLKFKNPIFYFNEHGFQDPNSSTCGWFSLYFVIHRLYSLDIPYHQLLYEIFDVNKAKNETLVKEFFSDFQNA